jgi:integrase
MRRVVLTDTVLRALKPGDPDLWDARVIGLSVRVSPKGLKTWTLRYRPKGASAQPRVALGHYPEISLATARKRAEMFRVDVAGGADPQGERKAAREADKQALTFDDLASQYIERYSKPHKKSWQFDELYLRVHVRPVWESRKSKTITRADAAALLDALASSSAVTANRVHSCLSKLFNWAIESGLAEINPIVGLKKRGREIPKERTLAPDEIRCLWNASGSGNIANAIRLILLTALRPGEAAGIAVEELHDLSMPGRARIEIPAIRMKGGKQHVVPLAPIALAIIREQLSRAVGGQTHVFASTIVARGAVARHSLSQLLKRTIQELRQGDGDKDTIARLKGRPPTPHDLRRTAASGLAALGVPREDRLAILAHKISDVHAIHYDRHDRFREKLAALRLWEKHLAGIVESPEAALGTIGNVAHLRTTK